MSSISKSYLVKTQFSLMCVPLKLYLNLVRDGVQKTISVRMIELCNICSVDQKMRYAYLKICVCVVREMYIKC